MKRQEGRGERVGWALAHQYKIKRIYHYLEKHL